MTRRRFSAQAQLESLDVAGLALDAAKHLTTAEKSEHAARLAFIRERIEDAERRRVAAMREAR
jgi:hypothetical protein